MKGEKYMNKLFTKIAGLALGAVMAVGVGVAVSAGKKDASPVQADVGTAVRTCDFTAATTGNSNYGNTWTYATDFSVTGGANNNKQWAYCKFGGKGGSTTSATQSLTSSVKTGPITNQIAKFSVVIDSIGTQSNVTVTSSYLYVYSDSGYSTQIDKVSLGTTYSASGTLNATPTSGNYWAANSYYKWEITSTIKGKSNIGVCIDKLVWYQYTAPVQTYTVSFAVNTAGYGTLSSSSINNVPSGSSISVNSNKVTINGTTITATPSANTAQYTYAFSNWSNTSGTITAARTITANFTRTTNTFTVDDSGITGGSLDSTAAIEYGGDLDVNIVPDTNYSVPTSVSVTMGGTDISGDVQYEDGYLYYTPVTGNIVVTAACIPEGTAYTVNYDANSGTVSPASEEVIENGHPSFPTPTRSGYNFKGWQVNGSGTAYTDPEDYTVTGDVTFVASWVAAYTVTFNANGGSSTPASISVEDGSTFTFPSAGTKTHYSFDGWTSTGDEPYYAAGATSPAVTGNITYTAHWTEDAKYTVTYSAASPASGSYAHNNNYGGTYTLLPFASLSGISYDSDVYQFKNYTVGGVNKNPGDTFTLSAATTVTVNFEEKPLKYQITFGTAEGTSGITSFSNTAYVIPSGVTLNNIQGNVYSNTSNQAASLRFGKSGTTGSFDATITGNYYIVSVTCNLKYYGSDSTATFAVTPNGGSAISKSLTGSWADYIYDVSSAKATKVTLGTDVNGKRAYLSGFTITYAALPELDSVTTSGQKVTFFAGEKFSYGGTLTAHYTKGKADATVTPASYKVGASGINPTSAGTVISAATTMTIDAHNGQYIYVVYTEDNITKWASYQITVNPAAPTGIELSPSSATIGIDDTFSFTDVEVTINPSEYATQNAFEWVMVDDLGLDVEFDYPDIVVHEDSNGEPLIIRCRSTVDNDVYADFELTVSGNPIAVLYDENDDDVTSGSASYYADYGNDIYYHVSATNFGTNVTYTWSSSNTSILSVDDEDSTSCGYYIEDGASGTARLSCVVSGSKGSATVYVDVTITAVSVSAVTWSAPTIDVFSGATLSASDTASWNVKYSTNSGKTNLTPDSFNVKLGGSIISLPHTWVAADHNKTLCVEVGGVSSSTTTVAVTQRINNVYAESFSSNSSDLTFTEACGGSGTTDDSKAWTVTSDGTESNYDGTKGIHYGTGSAAVQYIKLTSSDFTSGKITKVEVNASTASGVSATVSVTVGGEAFGGDPQDLTSSAVPSNPYTFTGNVDADTIEVLITKPSSATKAIYCKSIVVTYETSSGSQNIANNASHKAAQRVAVKFAQAFNAAMDVTENCTTGLSSAWSTCSTAYNTFKAEAAALGSAEEAYAKNLIKYATAQYSDDSGEACIERMMKTYEICVQKHGQTAFMSELVTLSPAHVNPISVVTSNGSTVAIVVVTAMISLTAVGGYFFLRRRKEI